MNPDLDPCGSDLQDEARDYINATRCLQGRSLHELIAALLLAQLSQSSNPDFEPVVACGEDGGGNQIPVLITYAYEQDGTFTITYTNLTDNTPYVGPIVMCENTDWQVSEPAFFCDNGTQSLIRRDIFQNGVIFSTTWTDLEGNVVANPNPLTLTAGACNSGGTDVNVVNGPGAAAVNIQDGGNSITVDGTVTSTLTSTGRTTSIVTTSASSTTTAGIKSVTFIVTTGPVLIDGESFGTGSTLSISAPLNDTLNAISYDATGGVLKIVELN